MADWTCVGRGREKAWQSEEAMSTRGREHNNRRRSRCGAVFSLIQLPYFQAHANHILFFIIHFHVIKQVSPRSALGFLMAHYFRYRRLSTVLLAG